MRHLSDSPLWLCNKQLIPPLNPGPERLRERILTLAKEYGRYGNPTVTDLLRRESCDLGKITSIRSGGREASKPPTPTTMPHVPYTRYTPLIIKAKPNPAGKDRVSGITPKKQLAAEWVDFKNIGDESFGLQSADDAPQ